MRYNVKFVMHRKEDYEFTNVAERFVAVNGKYEILCDDDVTVINEQYVVSVEYTKEVPVPPPVRPDIFNPNKNKPWWKRF